MRRTTIVAAAVAISVLATEASAQQNMTGIITKLDRLSGTISIQQPQSGTVGAGTGPVQEFKVTDGKQLEPLHAGDKVTFTASDGSGTKTITDLKKQQP